MDYHLDPVGQYPQEPTKWPGMNPVMRLLEEIFDPEPTRISIWKDRILVSLDSGYDTEACRLDQLGVACLDTREISRADNDDFAKDIISSRLILLRKQRRKRGKYLFGKPEKCYGGSAQRMLQSVFTIIDPRTTEARNIILVGHGIRSDIMEIQRVTGLNILELPTIKAVIDTSPLMNRVFHTPGQQISLRSTCRRLGMYRRNIHSAGNDAMYTLKALLLIFCHYKEGKQFWSFDREPTDRALLYRYQLDALRSIDRCSNGIDRYAGRRKKNRDSKILFRAERKEGKWRFNLMADDKTDESVTDGLFST